MVLETFGLVDEGVPVCAKPTFEKTVKSTPMTAILSSLFKIFIFFSLMMATRTRVVTENYSTGPAWIIGYVRRHNSSTRQVSLYRTIPL